MDSLRRNKVGLKGILYTPVERSEHTSWNVAMRQQLDIYASVVLCKSVPGVPTRHRDVDFAIIRENTEGEYSGLEHQSSPGVVESLKIMTAHKTERIARFAFDFAIKNGRKVRCREPLVSRESFRLTLPPLPSRDPPAARDGGAQGQHHEAR